MALQEILSENKPIKMWLTDIEIPTLNQAKELANLPFTFKHVALMPDCHLGYGMPIGGVLATYGVVIPNAVGVDIGCGMTAVKTNILVSEITINLIKQILGGKGDGIKGIRKSIPTGMKHHKVQQNSDFWNFEVPDIEIIRNQYSNATKQLGTLGSGNHFIEIQKGSDGYVWIMVHSGSRNIGLQIATYYNKKAQQLCKKWYSSIPEPKGKDGLAFLPVDTNEGKEYIEAMNFALKFAFYNRKSIIETCISEFKKIIPHAEFNTPINIPHNYVSLENHFNKDVWIHRKGATSARKGEVGIIPGSQGTASYIVEGLGNEESFMSCSHGAGRKMGRKEAIKKLNLDDEVELMNKQGILHGIRGKKDLDEAPGAYKDINEVMKNQTDLVKILVELKPLAVIKG